MSPGTLSDKIMTTFFWGRAISQNWMSRMCAERTICALASRLVSVNTILTSFQKCVQTNRLDILQTDAERQNKDLNTYVRCPVAPVYFQTPFGWEAEIDRIKEMSKHVEAGYQEMHFCWNVLELLHKSKWELAYTYTFGKCELIKMSLKRVGCMTGKSIHTINMVTVSIYMSNVKDSIELWCDKYTSNLLLIFDTCTYTWALSLKVITLQLEPLSSHHICLHLF